MDVMDWHQQEWKLLAVSLSDRVGRLYHFFSFIDKHL